MKWIFLTGGLSLIGLAVFAYQLGIDHTPDWGTSRIGMFELGLILLLVSAVMHKWRSITSQGSSHPAIKKLRLIRSNNRENKTVRSISNSLVVRSFTEPGKSVVIWITVLIVLLGWLTAWWLVTAGHMGSPPQVSTYFDRQAEAFLHGQLFLLEKPDPRLAELENPYDYLSRGDIPVLWDATYYQGKYFLYWGPVPALVAGAVKIVHPGEVNDSGLTLFFVMANMAVMGWLIASAFNRWFPRMAAGMIIPPLLAAIFSAPLLWLLPRPSVYEAAIASGQFFWLAGLGLVFMGFRAHQNKPLLMFFAGLTWAAAIGCRANLAVPILITYSGLGFVFLKKHSSRMGILSAGIAFAIGMGALGYFNFARFGSITETGYSYQLTGPAAISMVEGKIYSTEYILPNLYNNFLRPPQIDGEFPFIHSPWITEAMWPFFIRLLKYYYYSEPITGLLFASPFILFLPAIFRKRKPRVEEWILLAATAGSILTGLFFIATFMRYLLDFSPALILLASVAFWEGSRRQFFAWKCMGMILALISTLMGLLLALAGSNNNFLNNNPALFQWMAEFFRK